MIGGPEIPSGSSQGESVEHLPKVEAAPAEVGVVYREDLSDDDLQALGPYIRAGFGRAGHEFEYVIGIPGFDNNNFLPERLGHSLQALLGSEWEVMNRGTRLEAMPRGEVAPADEVINLALSQFAEDYGLDFPVIFTRPVIQPPVDREAIRRQMMEKLQKLRDAKKQK